MRLGASKNLRSWRGLKLKSPLLLQFALGNMDHSEQKKPEENDKYCTFLSHESSKLHRNKHTHTHTILQHIVSQASTKGREDSLMKEQARGKRESNGVLNMVEVNDTLLQ